MVSDADRVHATWRQRACAWMRPLLPPPLVVLPGGAACALTHTRPPPSQLPSKAIPVAAPYAQHETGSGIVGAIPTGATSAAAYGSGLNSASGTIQATSLPNWLAYEGKVRRPPWWTGRLPVRNL